MSVGFHNAKWHAICDGCGAILRETQYFAETIDAIKDVRWKIIRRVDGEWENYCTECAEVSA